MIEHVLNYLAGRAIEIDGRTYIPSGPNPVLHTGLIVWLAAHGFQTTGEPNTDREPGIKPLVLQVKPTWDALGMTPTQQSGL
jgi:hypothetical protein